jgi:acetyl-CoA carboxylase biotin carboxyl carrier protein
MDLDEIRQILQLMEENNLAEFELEREGLRVALRKAVAGVPTVAAMPVPQVSAPAEPVPATTEQAETPNGKEFAYINSPMVGTFYVAPSPDSPPFVNVGDAVTKDSVVCILEAMKVMNEIKAEVEGTIAEVLVENAEPVEYGEPLFRVEPA